MRWTVTIIAVFAIVAGLAVLTVGDRGQLDTNDASAPRIATGAAISAAIASPFSEISPGAAVGLDHDNGLPVHSSDDPTVLDTSQDQHIAESRRNYRLFLARPDGYLKYEALAGVHHEDVPGLDKVVHDRNLSYHGRLAIEELRYQISTSPFDHAGNAERYVRMLEVIAKAPCPPDEHWDDCIIQTLGITRTDVERAQADASILRDQRNLAQLRVQLAGRGPDTRLPMALYDSLTPLLARSLEGDEETIRLFGLSADGANEIIGAVNESLSSEPFRP
jgi:hypothetical protein